MFPLCAVALAYKKRQNLKRSLFLDSTAFDLMFTAMIIFVPLAQCIGHRSFIEDAVGQMDNLSYIRRLIEESMEFMAYVLILLASIEMYSGLVKKQK